MRFEDGRAAPRRHLRHDRKLLALHLLALHTRIASRGARRAARRPHLASCRARRSRLPTLRHHGWRRALVSDVRRTRLRCGTLLVCRLRRLLCRLLCRLHLRRLLERLHGVVRRRQRRGRLRNRRHPWHERGHRGGRREGLPEARRPLLIVLRQRIIISVLSGRFRAARAPYAAGRALVVHVAIRAAGGVGVELGRAEAHQLGVVELGPARVWLIVIAHGGLAVVIIGDRRWRRVRAEGCVVKARRRGGYGLRGALVAGRRVLRHCRR